MTEINGRPQPYIGVGGVVGAGTERELEKTASSLGVSERGRLLVVSANATHDGQMSNVVEPWHVELWQPGKNWNPQNADQLHEALDDDHDPALVSNMATIRFHDELVSNPGYVEVLTKRTLERAPWADIVRFSGLSSSELQVPTVDKPSHVDNLLAHVRSQAHDKLIAVEYPLPTFEALRADGALESIVEQLAHYAKVLDYIVLTTKEHSIQSARALLEAVYETPELASTGFAVEAQTRDKATNTRVAKLTKDFSDLSVHAEDSLHPITEDKTFPLDIVSARKYVQTALDAIDARAA